MALSLLSRPLQAWLTVNKTCPIRPPSATSARPSRTPSPASGSWFAIRRGEPSTSAQASLGGARLSKVSETPQNWRQEVVGLPKGFIRDLVELPRIHRMGLGCFSGKSALLSLKVPLRFRRTKSVCCGHPSRAILTDF